jgi:cysteinyl-tRNA synthetase
MVRDLLETGWSADAIRMVMVGRHYRKPWSYEESGLAKAAEIAEKLKAAVTVAGGDGQLLDSTDAEEAFTTAMDNDLDTPTACNVLEGLAESILSAAARGQDVRAAQKVLRDRCTIFGLTLDHAGPQAGVVAGWAIHRRRFMSEIDRQTSQ